jgi:tungstate transport system substrate-binding protein
MRATFFALAALLAAPALAQDMTPTAVWGEGRNVLRVATGSPGELGLLEALATDFAKKSDAKIVWFRAGSGAAMKLLQERKVDMALAHAPAAERKAAADGWATGRNLFGSNEFWIVGPKSDPAKIAGTRDIAAGLKRIADTRSVFVSRGDNSGTHAAERRYFKDAGVDPTTGKGSWYRETGSGMGPALNTASSMNAYILADRGTWLAFRNRGDLAIVVEGDRRLFNPYGVMLVNPAKHPHVRAAEGRSFIDWLVSAEGQRAIAGYEVGGEPLFFPSAHH